MKTVLKEEAIPYSDGNPFLTLFDLICHADSSVASLATAIEQHGVFGWDRFGRFQFFEQGAAEAKEALDVLAFAYTRYQQFATYDDEELAKSPLANYGWASAVFPEYESKGSPGPTPPERSLGGNSAKANLAIVGALLAVIRGDYGNPPAEDLETEEKIIDLICGEISGYGLGRRNLQDKFRDAKRVIKPKPADD